MKKAFAGILAVLYMTVSSGIAMEIHYCMGKKAGIELYGSSSDKCGKCGMKDNKTGCCHNELKFYKLQDSHKSVSNDINFTADEIAFTNDHYLYDCDDDSSSSSLWYYYYYYNNHLLILLMVYVSVLLNQILYYYFFVVVIDDELVG